MIEKSPKFFYNPNLFLILRRSATGVFSIPFSKPAKSLLKDDTVKINETYQKLRHDIGQQKDANSLLTSHL